MTINKRVFLKKIWKIISPASWYLRQYQMKNFCEVDSSNPLPDTAPKVLENCCNALEKAGIKYFLSWGTALGFYRNKDFIKHDTDIDIDIIDKKNYDDIENALKSQDMKLARAVFFKKRVQQLIFVSENGVLFDIMFWTKKRNILGRSVLLNFAEPGWLAKLPYHFSQSVSCIEYKNKKYPVYFPIEEYLATVYGKDWIIPKKSKGDWKNDCSVISELWSCKISNFIFKIYERIRPSNTK
jgi:hypothetical protein